MGIQHHTDPMRPGRTRCRSRAFAVLVVCLLVASGCSSASSPDTNESTSPTTPTVAAQLPATTTPTPASSSPDPTSTPAATNEPPNILLLIADDLGIESGPCYGVDSAMVGLEARCASALVFDTAWSSPTCSPTRSGLLTGQHTFRTGVGAPGDELSIDAATLPRTIRDANPDYALASFGKWHLGGDEDRPNDMGWDHFSGLLRGGLRDYESWEKITNGVSEQVNTYATTEITNNAIDWIADQDQSWLAWVGYTAPHTPFHLPPTDLHRADLSGTQADIDANPVPYYEAAVEALDTEIARLLSSLPDGEAENTIVIFIGDNGNPGQVSTAARGQAKGSLYPGGIQIPMMAWGPGLTPGRTSELVGTIDIHSTILDLLDIAAPQGGPVDSVSFVGLLRGEATTSRDYLLGESVGGRDPDTDGRTVRSKTYQLLETAAGDQQFFDLATDPNLTSPLPLADLTAEQSAAFTDLTTWLTG